MENLKAELQSEIAQWVGMGNQVDIFLLFLIIKEVTFGKLKQFWGYSESVIRETLLIGSPFSL